jgi:hypothetical protein
MTKIRNLMVLMAMVIAFGLVIMGTAVAQFDTATDSFSIIVDAVAVIGVDGVLGNLTVSAPLLGGDELVVSADDTGSYLQYTSIVEAGHFRTITVAPSQVPAGIELHIGAGVPNDGEGDQGTPAGNLEFTHTTIGAQVLIAGIGSCYTDIDSSDGAQLTIWIEIEDIGELAAATSFITLTYTLTDEEAG